VKIPVEILRLDSEQVVEANLFDDVTVDHFLESQVEWRPLVLEAAKVLKKRGVAASELPAHWHWNWGSKASDLQALAFSFFGIECDGQLQGLMKLDIATRSSRLIGQKGKPIVYVDYIETAPWNVKFL